MNRFRYYLRQLGLVRDDEPDDGGRRDVDNVDAAAAAQSQHETGAFEVADHQYPPGYVKGYDEGRPPH